MKTKKNLKKFIKNSASQMVKLLEMKEDDQKNAGLYEKIIRHQKKVNTMILKDCFDLDNEYQIGEN